MQTATAVRLPSARISGMIAILPINRLVVGTCARSGTRDGIEMDKNQKGAKLCACVFPAETGVSSYGRSGVLEGICEVSSSTIR